MKYALTVLLLFFLIDCSFAQYEFTEINKETNDGRKKVKTLSVYYFETATDSILTAVNTYDSIGAWLTTKTFVKDGSIASQDTLIYDKHHYQQRRISTASGKIRNETININDINGKPVYSKITGDSVFYETFSTYDKNGLCIKMQICSANDTTTIDNFYNIKGLLVKSVQFNKKYGKTVIKRAYNALGKMTRVQDNGPVTRSVTELKYDRDHNLSESTSIANINGKETVTSMIYTYYPNGLTYEIILAVNGKAITLEKIFYTYY